MRFYSQRNPPRRERSYESFIHRRQNFILWTGRGKEVPPPPQDPASYPESDARHWYYMEYAGQRLAKAPALRSPGDGPENKRLLCLKAESGVYQQVCEKSMIEIAQAFGMHLSIRVSGWERSAQDQSFYQAVSERPDLIINIPNALSSTAGWYKAAYEAGIPVVGSILMPALEAFPYMLAWCGHDAWMESRMLARHFAELMNYEGGYCIVRHMPDTSVYYSRTYGVLTELSSIAPKMRCLAMETSYLREDRTEELVGAWLSRWGNEIRGIVSPEDVVVLNGINKALSAASRENVIRVSNGTISEGLECVKAGTADALTFKSPSLDGALPIQVAADWFNGLVIDPIRFLPTHIITRDDVDDFLDRRDGFRELDLDALGDAIEQQDIATVDRFFDSIYVRFVYAKVVSLELFHGLTIELLSELIEIIHRNDMDTESIVGTYESVFKSLFRQPSLEATIEWLRRTAHRIIEELRRKSTLSRVKQVIAYVGVNLAKPLSLKGLSYEFGISAHYLGKQFRDETGQKFNDYVNQQRIHAAAGHLRNSSMSAAEIARKVGYDDPNYFYKLFKKYMHMHPTQYRRLPVRDR